MMDILWLAIFFHEEPSSHSGDLRVSRASKLCERGRRTAYGGKVGERCTVVRCF